MSAPSSGSSKVHAVEQQEIIDLAFGCRPIMGLCTQNVRFAHNPTLVC